MADIPSIQPAGGSGATDPGRPGKNDKSIQGPSFSDVLDKTSQAGAAGAAGQIPGAPGPLPPAYIGPVESAPAARESVARVSEEFFRLFDTYQTRLGSPDASLKEVEPLMRDLELLRDKLMGELEALPQGDPGRGILEEMAGLVTSESAKFNRGDYI